jgi:hypothetical protein
MFVQVYGGNFQLADGQPLASSQGVPNPYGQVLFKLSQDAGVFDTSQICPPTISFPLNNEGSVPQTPEYKLWGNDSLLPAGTFYYMAVYDGTGALVFGPTNVVIMGPGPINLATLTPANSSVSYPDNSSFQPLARSGKHDSESRVSGRRMGCLASECRNLRETYRWYGVSGNFGRSFDIYGSWSSMGPAWSRTAGPARSSRAQRVSGVPRPARINKYNADFGRNRKRNPDDRTSINRDFIVRRWLADWADNPAD